MHRKRSSLFVGLSISFACLATAAPALAEEGQAERVTDTAKALKGQPGSFEAGGFVFRPLVELRLRAEAWSGAPGALTSAVLAAPTATGEHERDAVISERFRIGLAVERGPVTAVVKLEDARSFGDRSSYTSTGYTLPYTGPYEAYLDIHTRDRDVFFRGGRQEIVVGDGRLIGKSEDAPIGRSLDALRIAFRKGNFDVQAFAAMLAPPGHQAATILGTSPTSEGLKPGAQLYVADATWHARPSFKAELTGIARIVRDPFPFDLTPADTFVGAARVFGAYRGLSYSLLGAFEGGRIAEVGNVRNQIAGAAAGRGEYEAALPWHLTFGVQGAYATGGDRRTSLGKEKTFDPILPDSNDHFGHSGFYAWSNIIEGGADVAIQPIDALRIRAAYRFAGLANAHGEWFSSLLEPYGYSPTSSSHILGNVIEGTVRVTPWEYLGFIADYGAMILGAGGKAILDQGGHDAKVLHFGLLEAQLKFPN